MSKPELPSEDEIAAQVAAFAAEITPDRARWLYCLSCVRHEEVRDGVAFGAFHGEFAHRVARILGRDVTSSRYRLGSVLTSGYEVAEAAFSDGMRVGALQPWMLGHVYFARIASHPHVFKVGFTRRLRGRFADIQKTCGVELLSPVLEVGTGANEAWWHYELRANQIAGEWFFDPDLADRSVPDFLQTSEEKAA